MNKIKKFIIEKAIVWLMSDLMINNGDSMYAIREYGITDYYQKSNGLVDIITIKFVKR